MKKPKKKTKWVILNKEFNTFKTFKTFAWYNLLPGEVTTGVELLWKYKLKYATELNKKELKSVIEVLTLLIIKINK